MPDTELRARYIRLLHILHRICYDQERLVDDDYFADYDQAIDAAKKLLEAEGFASPFTSQEQSV